jgi:hypothetical protein
MPFRLPKAFEIFTNEYHHKTGDNMSHFEDDFAKNCMQAKHKKLGEELVKLANDLCEQNYCYGFDAFVECYDKSEWLDFFKLFKVDSIEKLIPALNASAEMRADRGGDYECYYVCDKCDAENKRDSPKEFCDCDFYPSPDPQELHWQKEERKLSKFYPIPTDQPDYVWEN